MIYGASVMTATAEVIRQLREAAGLGRRELAEAAGISQVFLSKLEQGERRPSPKTLVRIAGALGLSVGDLASKIAVFEATTAPTEAEMHRGLLRAAAIGGGPAALAVGFLPGMGIAAAAAGASALARRKRGTTTEPDDDDSSDVEALRGAFIERARHMPPEQLTIVAAWVEEVWPPEQVNTTSAGSSSPPP